MSWYGARCSRWFLALHIIHYIPLQFTPLHYITFQPNTLSYNTLYYTTGSAFLRGAERRARGVEHLGQSAPAHFVGGAWSGKRVSLECRSVTVGAWWSFAEWKRATRGVEHLGQRSLASRSTPVLTESVVKSCLVSGLTLSCQARVRIDAGLPGARSG